jgi:hypothetical protein
MPDAGYGLCVPPSHPLGTSVVKTKEPIDNGIIIIRVYNILPQRFTEVWHGVA